MISFVRLLTLLSLIASPLAFAGGSEQFSIHLSQSVGDLDDARDFKGFTGYFSYEKYVIHHGSDSSFRGIRSLEELEKSYLRSNDKIAWDNQGIFERSELLSRYVQERTGNPVSTKVIMTEYAVQYAIHNPQDWAREFRIIGPRLSLQDKVLIASQLGGQFLTKYSVDRSLGGVGVVTIEELWASQQSGAKGGVCRDISKAQAQILVALGVPRENIYITAYNTLGGSHATIAIQDPENPQRLIKMNYDYIGQSQAASENSLLVQESGGLIDTGLDFRIYNVDGEPVGRIPSEVQSVMRKVFDSRMQHHPVTANFNLNKASVSSPWGTSIGFEAQTANGDQIQGLGHTFSIGDERSTKLKFSLAYLEREAKRPDVQLDQQSIYASIESDKKLAFWNIGDHTEIALGIAAAVELQFSKNHIKRPGREDRSDENADFSAFTTFYVQGEHQFTSAVSGQAEAGVTVYGDFADASAAHSGGYAMAIDHKYLDGRIDYEYDDYVGSAEVGIVFREFGNTAHVELGLQKDKIRGFVGVQGRTSDKTASFVPGRTRHIYGGFEKYEDERRMGRAYYSVSENGDNRASIEYKVLLGGKKRR